MRIIATAEFDFTLKANRSAHFHSADKSDIQNAFSIMNLPFENIERN
jgi:hypothetical protein